MHSGFTSCHSHCCPLPHCELAVIPRLNSQLCRTVVILHFCAATVCSHLSLSTRHQRIFPKARLDIAVPSSEFTVSSVDHCLAHCAVLRLNTSLGHLVSMLAIYLSVSIPSSMSGSHTRSCGYPRGRQPASESRGRRGGALESSTTDSARFCGIAAAADSRDGGASTRRVNCFVSEETGSFSFILLISRLDSEE